MTSGYLKPQVGQGCSTRIGAVALDFDAPYRHCPRASPFRSNNPELLFSKTFTTLVW